MTETEVTVSVGDMVVMKASEEEEVGADDASKTQVILQLQPITSGVRDESGESGATVVAVEAQDEDLVAGDDVELGYPITCGESKAVLLFKKFVCPGINVKCVKYEDQLISPKQFVHMSGKATLKDWKRAIRMEGVMLRKMMDSGQLDFYQHSTLCTNTCRSTKFDLLINNTRFPPDSSVLSTPSTTHGQVAMGNGGEVVMVEEKAEEATGSLDWSSATVETVEKKEVAEISEETFSFWKGIADVGLMGEVVSNIRTELLELLRGVQLRSDQANLQDAEVAVLSNLAQVFGLLDSIKRILSVRRQMTDPGEKQVLKALTSLELQLEEQKKQQSWLSQSQALSSLLAPSSPPAKRTPKRPRLQRPASTTLLGSTVTQPVTLQPQQFTVLSPIALPSVGQPFTVAGLAQPPTTVTLHALPVGSQVFTRIATDGKGETITLHPAQGITLLGTTAVQDPGCTVVSPMELVRLTQGSVDVEQEDETQTHTATVIEIDPAPVEHGMGVVELQLETDGAGGAEEATLALKEGEGEVVMQREEIHSQAEELQLEANGQIHNLQILVVEEEQTHEEGKSK
ncbi:glucocorticoid modulatory element-binding protein 1 [Pygocentrus nattereri]|uniref:SAND domain-containing protein n=1 Tax=Pygocentrus nattereri TaxID=42514 RepID=A0A3B4E2Q5_PYGNA|nr:glucocorticoid modulatory element-binding protein 1 [Pygocentrus nattereri]XP_017543074.2 glucocorticoid modulatory element-binding protein 1 [Pygocentrus nattereri]